MAEKDLQTVRVRNKVTGAEYEVNGEDTIKRIMNDDSIEVLGDVGQLDSTPKNTEKATETVSKRARKTTAEASNETP